jgi:CPA1 family monovalent cation:H+ antiporter
VSWHLLRFTFLTGIVLGAFLALATIAAVAVSARFVLLPGMPWTSAVLLGTVAAIFDTRLFHEAKGRPEVPRAIADTLKARELVTRLVVLATFALSVETARAGHFSPAALFEHYALDIPLGIVLGFAVGRAVAWARQRIDPAPVEIAVSIATPYGAALLASGMGLSVVAAVTTAALVVSAVRIHRRTGAPISSSETRVSATAFWEEVSLIVSSALFFLAGRALPEALQALGSWPLWQLPLTAAALLALVLSVQFGISYGSTTLEPIAGALAGRGGARASSRATAAGVMAWSSTRSVIGLVIALSIPATLPDGTPFPQRDLILVVAALAIVGSVFIQGLSLSGVVARAGLSDEDEREREQELARHAVENALASPRPEHANGYDAARQALVRLREEDQIGDERLVAMLRETDLLARAAEGDALPGAGPPSP